MPGLWWAVPQAWICAVAVGAYPRRCTPSVASGPGALYQPGLRPHAGAPAGLVRARPGRRRRHHRSALLAAAAGQGHRSIAERLGVPADTVRGWLRAARTGSPWLCQRAAEVHGRVNLAREDPVLPVADRTPLAYAVDALGAAAAVRRFFGAVLEASGWQLIVLITGGRLLRPPPDRSG
ncbi:helix-turn-helix domain-containing protein [Candidatus Mycobacterium methanotrophicum]|uniref:Helix-turn-helix domain-containing protein n=1 Tax=Candidatus Mycobacterium methanotrophicum TaxID=2943498 RepID=A0ABY4QNF4_9MYCO|nr:helix-turn-helix domain-containing protein [Candidatus Mycobacterium methanotrophicum]UQX11328.1 helix-turn-helix domain-containing protein [Candidatus Mycobacterium methanotrophicum]